MPKLNYGTQCLRGVSSVCLLININHLLISCRYEEQGHVDREMWAKLGAAGFLGISAPAEMGGVGGDFKYAAIFAEEQ